MLIVKTLEAESDRIDRFDVGDLREYFGDIRPFDLARLWKSVKEIPNSLYRRLFEDMDPHIVSEALV